MVHKYSKTLGIIHTIFYLQTIKMKLFDIKRTVHMKHVWYKEALLGVAAEHMVKRLSASHTSDRR